MEINDLLLKMPFRRILPNPVAWSPLYGDGKTKIEVGESAAIYSVVSQDDFLREYEPTGHKIHNPAYYPDRIKTDEAGNTYIHYVQRFSSPWQQVITTKQLTHLCGNPIRFTNSKPEMIDAQEADMVALKQGWIKKNMEVAWYKAAESLKVTGDAAICQYMDGGKIGWRVFSYLNDEILYPHYNQRTGKLQYFARRYKQYDETGERVTSEFVDVYDKSTVVTYIRRRGGGAIANFARKVFGRSGWEVVSRASHGFDDIPISYVRSRNGACWSLVQDAIDKYELAVSQLLENNQSYAFRILFLKGETTDIRYDSLGQPTAVTGDKDSEAKFLDKADVSDSFDKALKILLQNILTGSFTVLPPEVSTGSNIPGVTIKILYSPAVENAIRDANECNEFIDDVLNTFKFGYGIEIGKTAPFATLDVRGSIEPYVHQNDQEIIANINASLVSKSISRDTANQLHPYAASNEKEKVEKQIKSDAELEAAKSTGSGSGAADPNAPGMNDTNIQRKMVAETAAAAK